MRKPNGTMAIVATHNSTIAGANPAECNSTTPIRVAATGPPSRWTMLIVVVATGIVSRSIPA